MPPTLKEQIRYAKMNALAVRYVQVSILVVAVLGGIFGWAFYTLHETGQRIDKDVAGKQGQINDFNKKFVPKAKEASERLAAIAYVQGSQTHFSTLIDDIAKVVPQGISIDSMTLTGDDKKPMRIGFSATTYQAPLAFRNALITSPRVAAADLETITAATNGGFQGAVVIAFKPGQAK